MDLCGIIPPGSLDGNLQTSALTECGDVAILTSSYLLYKLCLSLIERILFTVNARNLCPSAFAAYLLLLW